MISGGYASEVRSHFLNTMSRDESSASSRVLASLHWPQPSLGFFA